MPQLTLPIPPYHCDEGDLENQGLPERWYIILYLIPCAEMAQLLLQDLLYRLLPLGQKVRSVLYF